MSIHHVECAALARRRLPDGSEQPLPAAKKLALMAMCDSADKVTRVGRPGLRHIMAWAGVGRSQALAIVAELIKDGWIERTKAGRKGQSAEFKVFAKIACCALHDPALGSSTPDPDLVGSGSGVLDPESTTEPVDNPASIGSGQPDPEPLGSGIGSDIGSGSYRTPSVSSVLKEGEGKADPSPPAVDNPQDPRRCSRHQDDPDPPPCGGCGRARTRHQATQAADDLAQARAARERRQADRDEQARTRQAAIDACIWCDPDGDRGGGQTCTHEDPAVIDERARARADRARARARAAATGSPIAADQDHR